MEIIRCLMPLFLSIIEMVLNNLTGKMNFSEFQRNLKEKLDEVGREITRLALEEIDKEIREDKEKRRGWEICRKKDQKEVVTNFGVVRYERTYYRHKESGRYAYLVDEEVGYTPHLRVDRNVKAKLVERAGDMAYRKAAMEASSECGGVVLSGQTVLKAVRQFKWSGLPQEARKQVPVLYIEAMKII